MKNKFFCKHRTLNVHKWQVEKTENGTKINAVLKCLDCGKKIPAVIERNVKWEIAHDNEYESIQPIELKHCPMCGAMGMVKSVHHEGLEFFVPMCSSCGLALPEASTRRRAAMRWNERV